jgi:hypothetical protein
MELRAEVAGEQISEVTQVEAQHCSACKEVGHSAGIHIVEDWI